MGKKGHGKSAAKAKTYIKAEVSPQPNSKRTLTVRKQNELNQLVETLHKVSSSLKSSPGALKDWENYLEITKLLEKIQNIEKHLAPEPVNRSSHFEEFVEWLVSNGAKVDGIKISEFPGYEYGLIADKDFERGDLLLSIPRKLMLTVERAKESVLGSLLSSDAVLQHMPNVALALTLLVEKFSSYSFWKPYINTLPTKYTTVLNFQPNELQELKGSPTLETALKQCRNIARQYAYFHKVFQTMDDPASLLLRDVFTYEQYRWAVSTVMTRQNFVPGDVQPGEMQSEKNPALVNAFIPMWDMCNHTNGELTTDYEEEEGGRSICHALQNFSKGSQIFIFYGSRPNSDLLVHNGFVFPKNEHDSLALRLGVSKGDPLHPLRTALLSKIPPKLPFFSNATPPTDFSLLPGPQPVDGQLLAFLRVFAMGKEQLEHWLESDHSGDLVHPDCAVDTQVESRAWNFLLTRVRLLLSAYSTTLKEDYLILEKDSQKTEVLTDCQRLAIQLRVCEKEILQGTVEYAEQRLRP
ncbi:actin-histidine N-methyltransferase [Ischnura elegans]|uniref:actin-histidine N-methyltransferase n=1 Tax=Ischnura elegans TaxID=197161 RepID=UPI001ED8A911|nr:actin-histidine N-methyltransferase [Ischnura elegans]